MVGDGDLARDSAQPVHEQLSFLLQGLAEGLGPGARMPTELELMERFRVSRATVRRALDTLVNHGLLVRHRGKGTFVQAHRMVHTLDQLRPFVAMFTESGREPQGRLLLHEWVTDPARMPSTLAQHEDEALHVRRLYTADDVPRAIADIFIPKDIGEQVTRADLEEHPVYQVVRQKLGLSPGYADAVVSSQAVTPELEVLGLERGSPLTVLERTTYSTDDVLLESTLLYLRPDSIELRLRVRAHDLSDAAYDFSQSGPRLALVDNLAARPEFAATPTGAP